MVPACLVEMAPENPQITTCKFSGAITTKHVGTIWTYELGLSEAALPDQISVVHKDSTAKSYMSARHLTMIAEMCGGDRTEKGAWTYSAGKDTEKQENGRKQRKGQRKGNNKPAKIRRMPRT